MPRTKLQNIVFTIIMAVIMVYGMIVYNVALNTGGVTNQTFLMARVHHVPHHEPDRHPAVQGAQLRHLGPHLRLQYAHGPDLAAALLRPPGPAALPYPVSPPAGRRRLTPAKFFKIILNFTCILFQAVLL